MRTFNCSENIVIFLLSFRQELFDKMESLGFGFQQVQDDVRSYTPLHVHNINQISCLL